MLLIYGSESVKTCIGLSSPVGMPINTEVFNFFEMLHLEHSLFYTSTLHYWLLTCPQLADFIVPVSEPNSLNGV